MAAKETAASFDERETQGSVGAPRRQKAGYGREVPSVHLETLSRGKSSYPGRWPLVDIETGHEQTEFPLLQLP